MSLLKLSTTCDKLDTSRNGLKKIIARDSTFPKPIKLGSHIQSPVFFDAAEIDQWIESKKAARATTAANDSNIGGAA
jgi:predicted DNA-binding transcriptional regulator AlpA